MKGKLLISAALAATLVSSATAYAESDTGISVAGGSASASARVNFNVVIPKIIFFQVGSAGGTIDTVTFDMSGIASAAEIGDGNAVAGDTGLSVRLRSNMGGNGFTIAADANNTRLSNGSGDSISWADIIGSDGGVIPLPNAIDGGIVTSAGFDPGAAVVDVSDTWTWSYTNANLVPAGTYSGQVTYTAATP